jgi:hypothetical protein
MNDVERIIWSSATTILGGMLLFVFGQWVLKFLIEPLQEQGRTIADVAKAMVFYSNTTSALRDSYYANIASLQASEDPMRDYLIERNKKLIDLETDRIVKASDELRRLACDLLSRTNAIPLYGLFGRLLGRPNLHSVSEAARQLIGFSNSLSSSSDHNDRIASIVVNLKLRAVAVHLGLEGTRAGNAVELAVAPERTPRK